MTRRFTLSLMFLLGFSTACSGERATEPAFESSAWTSKSANKSVSRPISGRCTTNIHSAVPGPVSLVLDMTGSCNLSHLGRSSLVIHQECYYAGPLAGTCDNTSITTAANGDRLYATWHSAVGQNTFDGCNAVFAGVNTYTGGTGRFDGATGSSYIEGTAACNPATGAFTGQYTLSGTISY